MAIPQPGYNFRIGLGKQYRYVIPRDTELFGKRFPFGAQMCGDPYGLINVSHCEQIQIPSRIGKNTAKKLRLIWDGDPVTIHYSYPTESENAIDRGHYEANFSIRDICRKLTEINYEFSEATPRPDYLLTAPHMARLTDEMHADICRAIESSDEVTQHLPLSAHIQVGRRMRPLDFNQVGRRMRPLDFNQVGRRITRMPRLDRDYNQRVLGQFPDRQYNNKVEMLKLLVEEKAKALLKTLVSKREYKRFEKDGYVIHKGKDLTYHIWPGEMMTEVYQDGTRVEKWCVIFKDDDKPPIDSLIMRLLMLRSDEEGFKEQANSFPVEATMLSDSIFDIARFDIASNFRIPTSRLTGA